MTEQTVAPCLDYDGFHSSLFENQLIAFSQETLASNYYWKLMTTCFFQNQVVWFLNQTIIIAPGFWSSGKSASCECGLDARHGSMTKARYLSGEG